MAGRTSAKMQQAILRAVTRGMSKKRVVKRRPALKRAGGMGMRVRGHGDYTSWNGSGFGQTKDLNQGVGAQLGRRLFGNTGGKVGSWLHGAFKKVTGYGDYKVSSNTLMMGNSPPLFGGGSGSGTIIRHREYIQDVFSSATPGAFSIETFPLNAGMAITFPWLATAADSWEQFCIRGAIFEFKSMSADALNSTNTALGSVIMATQYNSVAPPFTNKAQMENHEYSTSGKPSENLIHAIECARGETPISCLYTRTGPPPANADKRLYDLGAFSIATTGFQGASVNIGELWVTYDIEVLKATLADNVILEPAADHWYALSGVAATTSYLGTNPALISGNTGTVLSASAQTLTFPLNDQDVQYLVQYTVVGGATTLTNPMTVTLAGGAVNASYYIADTTAQARQTGGAVALIQFVSQAIRVPANSAAATFSLTAGTLPTANTGMDLVIVAMPSPSLRKTKVPRTLEIKSDDDIEPEDDKSMEQDAVDYENYLQFLKMKTAGRRSAAAAAAPAGECDDEVLVAKPKVLEPPVARTPSTKGRSA